MSGALPNRVAAGIGWMVAGTFAYAGLLVLSKFGMARLPLMELMLIRSVVGGLLMLAMTQRGGGLAMLRTRRPWGHAWRGTLIMVNLAAYFLAAHFLPVSDAVVLSFASTLFMTALSGPMLGERVGAHRWAAVLVGFAGVVIVARPSGDVLNIGAVYALASAVMSALIWIALRRMAGTENALAATFYPMLIGSVAAAVAAPFDWVTPTLAEWPLLLAFGLVGGLAQLFTGHAYRLAPTSVVAPFAYAQAVWAFVLAWLVYGEVPGPRVLLGGAIVVAAGLYILLREARRRA